MNTYICQPMNFGKGFLSLVFLLLAFVNAINAQFFDDFSDGNFTTNPTWDGDTAKYRINPSFELQLDDSTASGTSNSAYLSTASTAIRNAEWEFKFKISNTTSSQNYIKVYLVSSLDNTTSTNGYYVQIGNTPDEISLYRTNSGSNSKIIDGRDGTTGGSSTSGWVKVTRDSIGNWELHSDTSTAKSGYFSEGTVTDNIHQSTNYFGIYCRYSSSRKFASFIDSIKVTGTVLGDTVRPKVQSFSVMDARRIQVQFSEKVEPNSGLDTLNYSVADVNGVFYKDSAIDYVGADSTQVIYYLKENLGRLPLHFLSIKNIEDKSSNVLHPFNTKFTYPVSYNPAAGDVIITEIMCDPNPPVALPNADWVEIYNRSSKTFDLKNWTFSDRTTSGKVKLPTAFIAPNEYVVLCKSSDSASLAAFGGKVIGLPSFPNLNNADDLLSILDSADNLVDRVEYFDSWYKDDTKKNGGFTLEMINLNHPCSDAGNWIGSNSVDGGTPGKQNSTYSTQPDTVKPRVLSADLMGFDSLKISFSKDLDSSSLVSAMYSLSGGLSLTSVWVSSSKSNQCIIKFSPKVSVGVIYTVQVSNVSDCFGNPIAPKNSKFGKGKTPTQLQVIFNELFPDPDEDINNLSKYEYVELYNTSSELISLDSCFFADKSTQVQLKGGLIAPNDYLIICEKNAVAELSKYGRVLGLSSWPSLNNSGDELSLFIDSTKLIHHVNYLDDWYQDDDKKAGGWALELIDPKKPCDEANNWGASNDASGGTPGKQNSIYGANPNEVAPNLLRVGVINDSTIELFFDQVIQYVSMADVSFNFSHNLALNEVKSKQLKSLVLTVTPILQTKTVYTVTVNGLQNCNGLNINKNQAEFGLAESGTAGDVVINEILFNPYSTATSDYVELYNKSEKIIDLKNWVICEFDVNKDTLDGFKTIATESWLLLPGKFALIHKNQQDIVTHYPKHNTEAFIQLESLPTYSNDEGTVVILNDSSAEVDRVNYLEDWHHVLVKNPDGVSLERLDYNRKSQDEGNWHSAAKSSGFGTPGLENSQLNKAVDFSEQVIIQNETFSPDNDGFEDVLIINYNFDDPGNVANVTIFDAEGRKMKELANNELLAKQGTLTWDGSTDNNTKARSGMYILYFEIHTESGKVNSFKKPCVLAVKF